MAPKVGHKFNFSAEFLRLRGERIRAAKTGKFGTPEERFWSKVKKSDESSDGCHLWIGAKDEHGYGMFRPHGRSKSGVRANRFSLELKLGRPLKEGLKSLHTCDNPPCVRWKHLYEGTSLNNATDRGDRERVHSVLNVNQVLDARQRYADGERVVDIAKSLGFKYTTMYQVVKRKNWKRL